MGKRLSYRRNDYPRTRRTGQTVRLVGEAKSELRYQCFLRDDWTCVSCGLKLLDSPELHELNPRKPHMSHIKGVGAGGGDTLDNVECRCVNCHLVGIHNPKPCPPKQGQWR